MQQEFDQSLRPYVIEASPYDIVRKKIKQSERKLQECDTGYEYLNGKKIPSQFLYQKDEEESIREHAEKEFMQNLVMKKQMVPPQILNRKSNISLD